MKPFSRCCQPIPKIFLHFLGLKWGFKVIHNVNKSQNYTLPLLPPITYAVWLLIASVPPNAENLRLSVAGRPQLKIKTSYKSYFVIFFDSFCWYWSTITLKSTESFPSTLFFLFLQLNQNKTDSQPIRNIHLTGEMSKGENGIKRIFTKIKVKGESGVKWSFAQLLLFFNS